MRSGQGLDHGANGLAVRAAGGPDALIHGMKELETETIFL